MDFAVPQCADLASFASFLPPVHCIFLGGLGFLPLKPDDWQFTLAFFLIACQSLRATRLLCFRAPGDLQLFPPTSTPKGA